MIFSAHDINIIKKILPLHCESYLEERGWKKTSHIEKKASIWEKIFENGFKVKTLIPLDTELRDYKSRIIDFIETLKKVENRALESIITDLLQSNADTFRITAFKDKPEVSLPLIDASTLIRKTVDMMTSVAQSLIKPQPYFQYRHPKEVDDFLSKLKMGHTERGSFIVAIHAPVQPRLKNLLSEVEEIKEKEEPFERRVMIALSHLIPTAIEAANTRDEKAFEEAIPEGMSSNFCEALSSITEICGGDGAHLNIAWAPVRPIMSSWKLKNDFFVRPDTAGTLKEAAKVLRKNVPEKDIEIQGYVIRLDKNHDAEEGEIRIYDNLSDKSRNISIMLDKYKYSKAIEAHREGNMLNVKGDLDKDGKKQTLTNIKFFDLIVSEDN